MPGVSFTIDNLIAGFACASGLVSVEGDHLRVQLQVQDTVLKLFRSKARDTRIPLAEVQEVCFVKGWVGGQLVVRVMNLDALGGLPGVEGNELTLVVNRRNRHTAAEFASDANLAAAEARRLRMQIDRHAGVAAH